MKLSDYIKSVLESFDGCGQEVMLTFELNLDENLEVKDDAPNKVKFSVRNR